MPRASLSCTRPVVLALGVVACAAPSTRTGSSDARTSRDSAAPSSANPAPQPASSTPAAPSAGPAHAFTAPATTAGKDGAAMYVDPPKYDAANVAGVFPGAGSPEAAVVHYLASRVRRDTRYREVLSATCSSDCEENLAEHDTWTFRAFRLVSKTQESPGQFWIEVWMEIEFGGRVEEGTDQFTVVEEAGGYRIVEVPT